MTSVQLCICDPREGHLRSNNDVMRAMYGFAYNLRLDCKSTVFMRPHAMKRHKTKLPMLRNGELKFWTPVNFEVEYFLNEETEGVLTDTVIYLYDHHLTWLSQLKPNVKVG